MARKNGNGSGVVRKILVSGAGHIAVNPEAIRNIEMYTENDSPFMRVEIGAVEEDRPQAVLFVSDPQFIASYETARGRGRSIDKLRAAFHQATAQVTSLLLAARKKGNFIYFTANPVPQDAQRIKPVQLWIGTRDNLTEQVMGSFKRPLKPTNVFAALIR